MTLNALDLPAPSADADSDAADLVLQALDLAIQHVGGVSKMARALGVPPNQVSMWRLRKSVPPDQVVPMEQVVCGFVTRYQLRPKTFGAAPVPDQESRHGYLPAGIMPSEGQ